MKLEIYNIQGQKTGREIELPADIFGVEPNSHAVYLAVKQYMANQRQGTHKSKERSEIARSTRKAFRQKGTGGARRGDMKSPLVHGGARVFGPRPRDYSFRLNKKTKQLARASALSTKYTSGQITVIEDFVMQAPKTKEFIQILSKFGLGEKKSLLVTGGYEKNTYLSSRNIPKASVVEAKDLNTYQVLNANAIVLSESAIATMKEVFA